MPNLNKAQAENAHAKRRAAERLGVELTKDNRREIINSIQKGELLFVRKQSCRVSIFRCIINDQEIDVVYDKQRHRIITFCLQMMMPGEHIV